MPVTPVQTDLDFEQASKIMNVMFDPVSSDPVSPVTSQHWHNTTTKRTKGYDGTDIFTLLRQDGDETITGIFTYNPASGSVPFGVHSSKNGVVSNLNADRTDGYHAAEAATASTLATRDASGSLTVATPTSDNHAATKAYVDGIAAGQDWKDSVLAATTADIALSGEQTIDGVSVTDGDRVLVKDQSTGSENGIYVCSTGAWSRSVDADENAEVTSGLTTFVEEGTANAGSGYTLTTTGVIIVGTTDLTFARSSGSTVYTAGNGMAKSGTTFHFAQSASYTVGALPYASGASSIGMLAAVASGKVLKSNGTATAPLWAELDLTADVTGVLPTANGGTGTDTQFTQGSVIFAGASGVYTQDNSGLFFNTSLTRLGVGTSSPNAELHVVGSSIITNSIIVGANVTPVAKVDATGPSGGSGQGGSDGLGGVRVRFLSGYGASLDTWDSGKPRWGITQWSGHTPTVVLEGVYNSNQVRINHAILAASLASSSSNSVVTENSGVLEKRTISSTVWDGSFTEGSVPFAGSDGNLTEDNSNLFWDDSNNRLCVGTDSGSHTLTVNGTAYISGNVLFGDTTSIVTNFEVYDNTYGSRTRIHMDGSNGGVTALGSNAAIIKIHGGNDTTGQDCGIVFKNEQSNRDWAVFQDAGDGGLKIAHESDSPFFEISQNGEISITSTTLIDNLNADMVDGLEASELLDLGNSTGDSDDVTEGVTNLFFTNARAQGSISSADSAEIAYSSGVLGLGTEAGRVKSGTIGDDSSTSLTFTHSLGTRDVIVQVYRTDSPYDTVLCGVSRNSTSQVTLDFNTAPSFNEYTVVVTAANG